MKIFAGKSPTERNKIIAASVLGFLSLFSLYLAFGGSIFSSRKTSVTVGVSPTPTPSPVNNSTETPLRVSEDEFIRDATTTPIVYIPTSYGAPDPGRNIFAFYEPPPPTPYVTPPEKPTLTPKPPPPPDPLLQNVAFITPQSVYAGSKTFRLDVSGSGFTPETRILFNGSELPTTYVSPQQLSAEIPGNLIIGEGPRQIMTATPDGKLYSNQLSLNVEAPPKPKFQYIGMIARKHYNNDTAYFLEESNNSNITREPTGARLNDVVGERFRIISISNKEVVLEDVSLGFRHKLALYSPPPGQNPPSRNNNVPTRGNYTPYIPPNPVIQQIPQQQMDIPGIPNNIPRYNPTPAPQRNPANKQQQKDDDDDDDPDDGRPD